MPSVTDGQRKTRSAHSRTLCTDRVLSCFSWLVATVSVRPTGVGDRLSSRCERERRGQAERDCHAAEVLQHSVHPLSEGMSMVLPWTIEKCKVERYCYETWAVPHTLAKNNHPREDDD